MSCNHASACPGIPTGAITSSLKHASSSAHHPRCSNARNCAAAAAPVGTPDRAHPRVLRMSVSPALSTRGSSPSLPRTYHAPCRTRIHTSLLITQIFFWTPQKMCRPPGMVFGPPRCFWGTPQLFSCFVLEVVGVVLRLNSGSIQG